MYKLFIYLSKQTCFPYKAALMNQTFPWDLIVSIPVAKKARTCPPPKKKKRFLKIGG